MANLVKRLRDWETVYPCDADKPDGSLYVEAADRIEEDAKRITELALDALAAETQAEEAYQAQLKSEARIAELEAAKREARVEGVREALAELRSLHKSMAHFLRVETWEGYKKGVTDAEETIRALIEKEGQPTTIASEDSNP